MEKKFSQNSIQQLNIKKLLEVMLPTEVILKIIFAADDIYQGEFEQSKHYLVKANTNSSATQLLFHVCRYENWA